MDKDLVGVIIILSICVILPIVIVYLTNSRKVRQDNIRKDIILAAMEKDTDIDIEEMIKKLNGPKKLIKEKLMLRLLVGSIFVFFGILIYIATGVYMIIRGVFDSQMFLGLSFAAVPSLAIGIPFLANYYIGKKMLAKEMEIEEQNLRNR